MDLSHFLDWSAKLDDCFSPTAVDDITLQLIGEYLDYHGFSDVRLFLERRASRSFLSTSSQRLSHVVKGAIHLSNLCKSDTSVLPENSSPPSCLSILEEPLETTNNTLFCLPGQDINTLISEVRNNQSNQTSTISFDIFDCSLSTYLIGASLPSLLRRCVSDIGLLFSDPDYVFDLQSSQSTLPFIVIRALPSKHHYNSIQMLIGLRNSLDLGESHLPSPLPSFSSPCSCFPNCNWWQAASCRFLSTWAKLRPLNFSPQMLSLLINSLAKLHCPILSAAINLLQPSPLAPWLLSLTAPNPLLSRSFSHDEVQRRAIISFVDFSLFAKFASSSLLPGYTGVVSRSFSVESDCFSFWFNVLTNFSSLVIQKDVKFAEKLLTLSFELYCKGDFMASMAIFSPLRDIKQIQLPEVQSQQFAELKIIFSNQGNFTKLKSIENDWGTRRMPLVPYLGMHSSLVVSIDEMNSNSIGSMINIDKLKMFDAVVSKIDTLKANASLSYMNGELSHFEKKILTQMAAFYLAES
ncbi:hypothetical protein GEMRC1_001578 [Eukaryota sp. GEM-RC1]